MNDPLVINLLGWACQGFVTVGLLCLAAKCGLFPYVCFMMEKPKDPDRPRPA